MNKYKLFTLLLCLSLSTFAAAQSNRTMGSVMPAPSVDAVVTDLSSELALSERQIAELTKICNQHQEEQMRKTEATRENTDSSQDALNKKISSILTQQQRGLFTALTKKYSPSY